MREPSGMAAGDFLDRLVGKARGEEGGLRPRLLSFFEPTRRAPMDTLVEAEAVGLVDPRAVDTRRRARAGRGAAIQPTAPAAEAHAPETVTTHTRQPGPSSGTATETSPVARATPTLVARPNEPFGAPEAGDGVAPTPPPRLRASKASLTAVVDSAPTRNDALTPPAPGDAPSNPTASPPMPARESSWRAMLDEQGGGARLAGRVPPKAGALVPSPEPAARAIVIEAPAAPRRSISNPVGVERPTDDAPVVNVTIGRVEVRAVPAPTTQPPRRAEAPGPRPMSLAEYLEQRASRR